MKILLFILAFLNAGNIFCQPAYQIYQNYGKRLEMGNDTFYSNGIHAIFFESDTGFEYMSRPHVSCFTWRDWKGTWFRKNDTLFLTDQYTISEPDIRVRYKFDSLPAYKLNFRNDNNTELFNKNILIRLIYDFDSELDDIQRGLTLDSNNSITIPFNDIPDREYLASIEVNYYFVSYGPRVASLHLNEYSNEKEVDIPNLIDLELIHRPKTETVSRLVKGVINNDTLRIVSYEKTKSHLIDYGEDLMLEEFYFLRK